MPELTVNTMPKFTGPLGYSVSETGAVKAVVSALAAGAIAAVRRSAAAMSPSILTIAHLKSKDWGPSPDEDNSENTEAKRLKSALDQI
jgi:hypothetical protein